MSRLLICLMLIALPLAGCGDEAEPVASTQSADSAEQQAVRTVVRDYLSRLEAGDEAGARALVVDDEANRHVADVHVPITAATLQLDAAVREQFGESPFRATTTDAFVDAARIEVDGESAVMVAPDAQAGERMILTHTRDGWRLDLQKTAPDASAHHEVLAGPIDELTQVVVGLTQEVRAGTFETPEAVAAEFQARSQPIAEKITRAITEARAATRPAKDEPAGMPK